MKIFPSAEARTPSLRPPAAAAALLPSFFPFWKDGARGAGCTTRYSLPPPILLAGLGATRKSIHKRVKRGNKNQKAKKEAREKRKWEGDSLVASLWIWWCWRQGQHPHTRRRILLHWLASSQLYPPEFECCTHRSCRDKGSERPYTIRMVGTHRMGNGYGTGVVRACANARACARCKYAGEIVGA